MGPGPTADFLMLPQLLKKKKKTDFRVVSDGDGCQSSLSSSFAFCLVRRSSVHAYIPILEEWIQGDSHRF